MSPGAVRGCRQRTWVGAAVRVGVAPLAGSAVVYRYRRTSYVLPEQMSCGSRASEERRKVEEDCGAGGLFLRHGEKEKNKKGEKGIKL